MWRVSERVERCDNISAVEAVSARREDVFRGLGVGREERTSGRRGRSSSTSVGSGGMARGERSEAIRAVRVRVVWSICVVKEVCAVISLLVEVSMSTLGGIWRKGGRCSP